MTNELFNFDIPLVLNKSVDKGTTKRILKGYASTEDIDETGEKILQKGIDISYFLQQGFINYQHKISPDYIIGVPIKAEIKKSFYLEGELFHDRPVADAVWQLATTLEKENVPRKLGFSIQGKALEREENVITKAVIHMVSVTPSPANPHSLAWADIAKSIASHVPIQESYYPTNNESLSKEAIAKKLQFLNFGNVFTTLSKINDIKRVFMNYIENTPTLNYQDENLLHAIADYFVYVSLLSTNSVDDAIDVLTSLIEDLT